jgi:cytochrome c nitrite reductase small subunit
MSRKRSVVIAVLLGVVVLGGVGGVVLWQYHEKPESCASCHIMDPYLESWEMSGLGANAHGEEGVVCLDCHQPTLEQQLSELVVYLQGDYEIPLKGLKYPMESCFQCHEHGSYEEIIAVTEGLEEEAGANPHDSHYGEMECRLCHKMHDESESYCGQCHTFGFQVP